MADNSNKIQTEKELIQKMCEDNYDHFKALVRMHLSFELDMNMDEFDMPYQEIVYYEKGKLKKWDRLTKKIKSCASSKLNSPAEDSTIQLTTDLIQQLQKLKNFLMNEDNIKQEGIFRLTGSVSRQNELKNLISSRQPFNLESGYTVHDCATVFKNFLSNLPEPLLTDAHYPAYCQIAELHKNNADKTSSSNKENRILYSLQLLLFLLPKENRTLFEDVIEILSKALNYTESNKMSADSLATLFSPHLICPKNLPPEALYYVSQNMSKIISYMILKGSQIFEAPPKLLTDIRAYFLERKRKKTLSPEQMLNESISDLSTVNTVYTFIDREKTAAANDSDPTDTALAQLYAHIQSLPESSKKRKLIRQFNKENGRGTPLQFLMMNKTKAEGSATRSTKSISDSIKKHIFHKSILNRTPKRSNASLLNLGTPNIATKVTKSRILFQSPICNSNLNINNATKQNQPSCQINLSPLLLTTTTTTTTTTTSSTVNSPEIETENNLMTITPPALNDDGENFEESPKPLTDNSHDDIITNPISFKENTVTQSSFKQKANKLKMSWENCCKNLSLLACNQNYSLKKCKQSKFKSEPDLRRLLFKKENDFVQNECDKNASSTFNTKKINSMSNILSEFNSKNVCQSKTFLSPLPNHVNGFDNNSLNICKNKNLITSTPSFFFKRKSMSPITKSTQRMPKSMQESIMTPRSRKPVMLTTTLGSSEQNTTVYQSDLSGCREEDEDLLLMTNEKDQQEKAIEKSSIEQNISNVPDTLTGTFREYLLSRKVLTISPEDSSFSSHSDDFGSTPDIHNFSETDLSESLLFCLNGNNPVNTNTNGDLTSFEKNTQNYDVNRLDVISRKRQILQDNNENDDEDNKDILHEKKLLVVQETYNETSI